MVKHRLVSVCFFMRVILPSKVRTFLHNNLIISSKSNRTIKNKSNVIWNDDVFNVDASSLYWFLVLMLSIMSVSKLFSKSNRSKFTVIFISDSSSKVSLSAILFFLASFFWVLSSSEVFVLNQVYPSFSPGTLSLSSGWRT